MSALDWAVLLGVSLLIVGWGLWAGRGANQSSDTYLRGGSSQGWATIGLAVMATQASAITFLSVPGQAYEDGMRFVQVYLGMPLALIVVSAVLAPAYHRSKVYTAYELLEKRFGVGARVLGAALFLLQRGLAAGITLYAPAIILSALLGWSLEATVWAMGGTVVLYTVSGGAAAVAQAQKQQMVVMLAGIVVAALVVAWRLPTGVSVGDALHLAGTSGRLDAVRFQFDLSDRYNLWSGLLGGFFLSLAYFGTDQSQVGRYLGGKSLREIRIGLLFNAVLKIPMQALILLVGALVFVFFLFQPPPLHFNQALVERAQHTAAAQELQALQATWQDQRQVVTRDARDLVVAYQARNAEQIVQKQADLRGSQARAEATRSKARDVLSRALPGAETKDSDYIFLHFVQHWLPHGLVGLLVAVILFAAMSSIAGELSALGTTSALDLWRRLRRPDADGAALVRASQVFTVVWGAVAVGFASVASLVDNLIQAVNILGSLFYGTILGLFLAALWLQRASGRAVVVATLVAQTLVILLFFGTSLGFLWFNVVGCALVLVLTAGLSLIWPRTENELAV